ncbi:MAG: hypothetical protein AAF752_14160 [Bacteroidota bacterium]
MLAIRLGKKNTNPNATDIMAKKKTTGMDDLRAQFRALNLDQKSTFLAEAIFTTAGAALDEIGQRLSTFADEISQQWGGKEEEPPPSKPMDSKPKTKKKRTRTDPMEPPPLA